MALTSLLFLDQRQIHILLCGQKFYPLKSRLENSSDSQILSFNVSLGSKTFPAAITITNRHPFCYATNELKLIVGLIAFKSAH